jgi:endogenous inhibitor of DNA gyrase (YacG/DUF329 family)
MSSAGPREKSERCPLCRKPAAPEHRPFCSRGCRDRDLLNWLGAGYRVPGPPAAPEDLGGGEDRLDRDG